MYWHLAGEEERGARYILAERVACAVSVASISGLSAKPKTTSTCLLPDTRSLTRMRSAAPTRGIRAVMTFSNTKGS